MGIAFQFLCASNTVLRRRNFKLRHFSFFYTEIKCLWFSVARFQRLKISSVSANYLQLTFLFDEHNNNFTQVLYSDPDQSCFPLITFKILECNLSIRFSKLRHLIVILHYYNYVLQLIRIEVIIISSLKICLRD